MTNSAYLLALHQIDGLGPIRLKAILQYFKDPKLAWEAERGELAKIGIPKNVIELLAQKRKEVDPLDLVKKLEEAGIKWISIYDESYPMRLKNIYDPPTVLYYKGQFSPQDADAIAIVGTRKMTGYGKIVTEQFTKDVVARNLTVISGLARGVDTQAHMTAIEAGGRTLAVLGGGLNKIFPPENKGLVDKIVAGHGVVMSEYPPDYPALAGNFPSRNRIISGLSLAVLVTEAAEDSGSLITARVALDQGRDVFAVPGPITSTLSKGPIDLIKEGARAVVSADEILEELGVGRVMREKGIVQSMDLSDEERKVFDILENETRHIDEIGRLLNLPAPKISALLLKMEISGLIQNIGGGVYCKL